MSESHTQYLKNPCRVLSPREQQVLSMVSLGLTNGKIAAQLQITVHAVKFHLASIYRKLGVTNRTEAAVMYLRSRGGLVSQADS